MHLPDFPTQTRQSASAILMLLHVSGASDFPVDPSIPAWAAPALWAADALSAIIALVRAPEIYAAATFTPLILTPYIHAAAADDGLHVIMGDRAGPLRLWIADDCHGRPAVVIPLDESCWVRLHHLRRFIEHLYGRRSGPLPNVFRPTRYRIRRLAHALQALTAKRSGATARDIAALTDPEVKSLSGSLWKDVHQRARVERLLTLGEQLAAGEYLALLQYGRRAFPQTTSRTPR
ncbi:DUF2285 domain-containing protein [Komagataeibacter nataicola]|uniref:DUF2285 domain-containing protein n=1 Tax=Komagataeibacter nataicola TaxID=265960 RepID=UPI0023DD343B|nr:DUF2285 domain-containing protein [Komagataeibacter nataicola]WEQ57365.1 DUF2285 domain-containing protein [Komagataeibacter nataicola]